MHYIADSLEVGSYCSAMYEILKVLDKDLG